MFTRLTCVCLLTAVGCGKSGPPDPVTHAVTGKVILKGGQPLAGGSIQFESVADRNRIANSPIKSDGTFSLSVFSGNKRLPGAPEGEYDVTIIGPQGSDQTTTPIRVLSPRQKIATGSNNLTIEVERLRK